MYIHGSAAYWKAFECMLLYSRYLVKAMVRRRTAHVDSWPALGGRERHAHWLDTTDTLTVTAERHVITQGSRHGSADNAAHSFNDERGEGEAAVSVSGAAGALPTIYNTFIKFK